MHGCMAGWTHGCMAGLVCAYPCDELYSHIQVSLHALYQARSKQCMIGPAEINMKLPVGGLGRAASPPAGSGAEPREPNAFQQKYNENGFKLLTIGGEQACCRTVALLYTPKSDCVVSARFRYDRLDYWSGQNRTNRTVCYGPVYRNTTGLAII